MHDLQRGNKLSQLSFAGRIMFRFIIILSLILSIAKAQSAEKEGPVWKAWKKLEKVILDNNEKESIALLSGRMKDGFFRFGMISINTEVRAMEAKFVREFANEVANTSFLTVNVKGEQRTLMFIKSGKEWLFDEQMSEAYTNAEDAAIGFGQFISQQKLKDVLNAVIQYCNSKNIKRIPPPEEMEFQKDFLTYRNPEDGESSNILLVRNVDFEGKNNLLLAVTENIIGAAYHAVFEDGSIGTVNKENFVKHLDVLGKGENSPLVLKEKEIQDLVKQLGAAKSKDRKAAREKLLQLDEGALKTLVNFKESPDLEVRLSMEEIIEAISKKSSSKRPRL